MVEPIYGHNMDAVSDIPDVLWLGLPHWPQNSTSLSVLAWLPRKQCMLNLCKDVVDHSTYYRLTFHAGTGHYWSSGLALRNTHCFGCHPYSTIFRIDALLSEICVLNRRKFYISLRYEYLYATSILSDPAKIVNEQECTVISGVWY